MFEQTTLPVRLSPAPGPGLRPPEGGNGLNFCQMAVRGAQARGAPGTHLVTPSDPRAPLFPRVPALGAGSQSTAPTCPVEATV